MPYLIVLFFILALVIFYARFKPKKKKPLQDFPSKWHKMLLKNVHFYKNISAKKQSIFQKRMMLFLQEISIEFVQIEDNELDRVLVAASAIIPVLGFEKWHYINLTTVLIYPNNFNEKFGFSSNDGSKNIMGMVGSGAMEGQMILSQKALRQGFKNATDKKNTAIHEFVHLIDKRDGVIDGVPKELLNYPSTIPWLKLIHDKMEAINNDKSDIRNYGGTNQAEFFAVASEYFFERPDLIRRKHPELYKMMVACFQQQPKYRK